MVDCFLVQAYNHEIPMAVKFFYRYINLQKDPIKTVDELNPRLITIDIHVPGCPYFMEISMHKWTGYRDKHIVWKKWFLIIIMLICCPNMQVPGCCQKQFNIEIWAKQVILVMKSVSYLLNLRIQLCMKATVNVDLRLNGNR